MSNITDWLGVPGALVAWGCAIYILVVSRNSLISRVLVALLIVDGIAIVTSGRTGPLVEEWLGADWLSTSRLHQASDWALVAIYLSFIGMTLRSPLVSPLKSRGVQVTILVAGAIISTSMLVLPNEVRGPLVGPFYLAISMSLAWGFTAAAHSWWSAEDGAYRTQAKAFAVAFGVRDVVWATTFALAVAVGTGLLPNDPFWNRVRFAAYQLVVVIYVPLVVYGVLRTQLFDIDLRIKKTLRRSLILAAFVASFFVVSELAAVYLSDRLGNVLGLVCTGLLVFLLEPIQRAAQRFSDAAMPHTHSTPEYEAYRKLQVYEAAYRAALEEGEVSSSQRRVLDSLVQSLGLDSESAGRLEADLRGVAHGA